jgi:hypothetical protein
MKKLCLYFLMIFMATYNTGAGELLKLPAFFSHYAEHSRQNAGLDFSEFIDMHYLGHDANDNDDRKDAQLPFKNYHYNTQYSPVFIPVATDFSIVFKDYSYLSTTPYPPHFWVKDNTTSLFRPPCC